LGLLLERGGCREQGEGRKKTSGKAKYAILSSKGEAGVPFVEEFPGIKNKNNGKGKEESERISNGQQELGEKVPP